MAKDTEQLILEAARQQFVQNGFAATRMQEIADEAGINKAMLHYYFRTKEKLYQEIIGQILNTVIPQFAKAMEYQGTVMEKIEEVVHTYISVLTEYPDIPFFIMSELSQKRESFIVELKKRAQFSPVILAFMSQMQQEMNEGKIRKIPPVHLLLNILAMCAFPFMAKPIFCNIMNIPENNFDQLMQQRKEVIVDFVRNALEVNESNQE
ncbi:MAG: helix-turn-helix domain-containing protein [Chitinophagales bacterium]